MLKQRLLVEGKVPEREGKFDDVASIIPTGESILDWINQSKNFGCMLLKDRSQGSMLGVQQNIIEQNYGTAMEIDNETFKR